jgi:AraC-like DNA-binding protein
VSSVCRSRAVNRRFRAPMPRTEGVPMDAASPYVVSNNDTSALPAAERRDFWRGHVRTNHGGLELRFGAAAGFTGSTVVQRSENFQVVEFSSDAIEYERRTRALRDDDDRSLRVLVPRSGRFRIGHGDDRAIIGAGSAVALSMATPFFLGHDGDARAWVISLPEHRWPRSAVPIGPRMLDLRSGVGAVAWSMLEQVSRQRDSFSDGDFARVGTAITGMFAALGTAESAWPDIAEAASEFVRVHSDDPALTPAALAHGLGWSIRHVQVVLAAVGSTPSDLIRASRLARARERLNDPELRLRTIADIAHASGFGSVSAFNSAFRVEFGVSPREARAARTRP